MQEGTWGRAGSRLQDGGSNWKEGRTKFHQEVRLFLFPTPGQSKLL